MTDADITSLNWNAIDPLIFDGPSLLGIIAIRKATGCTLREAIERHADRYCLLRERHPEKFKVSHEQYWEGFYS